MAGSKPATRLYVEAALAPGQTVGLDHGQAHFLRSVLRPGPGARLAVFNGRDGEWLAEIDALGKGGRSEEHTSELQSLLRLPDVVFRWKNTKLKCSRRKDSRQTGSKR